jgi:abortive infection bacteriophage resistance protein
MDAIERIEISVRTSWTYHMGHDHGSHSHLDKKLAVDRKRFGANIGIMEKEVNRADEVFVRHAANKYKEQLPAIWVVSEVISLGLLSKLYGNLKPRTTLRAIAGEYSLDKQVMGSWLHHLTYLRNICAHHSRLWNREFIQTPMYPKSKPTGLRDEFQADSRKLYNTLIILLHFMDVIAPKHKWRSKMVQLLRNPNISLESMSFPDDWQTRKIWQEVSA